MARYPAIDSARGLAVVLAMLGHATNQFARNVADVEIWNSLQLLATRTATPTFMILFGIMIELAYLRKLRGPAPPVDAVRRRLLSRMVTCFLLFAAVAGAAMIAGKLDPVETLKAIFFLGPGRFGNVLKIYTGLFLLVVLTLPWAIRWGARFYLALAALAWALKYLLVALGVPNLHLVHFIFGHGTGFGPSILLGVTLLAYGVLIGEAISGQGARLRPALMLALAVAMMTFGVATHDPVEFVLRTITEYRWTNNPYYFAYGIATCSASLVLFSLIWRRFPAPAPALSLERLGHDTLFYYGFGNIFINLLPFYSGQSLLGFAYVALFLAALTAITLTRHQVLAAANAHVFGLPNRLTSGYGWINAALVAGLSRALPGAPR